MGPGLFRPSWWRLILALICKARLSGCCSCGGRGSVTPPLCRVGAGAACPPPPRVLAPFLIFLISWRKSNPPLLFLLMGSVWYRSEWRLGVHGVKVLCYFCCFWRSCREDTERTQRPPRYSNVVIARAALLRGWTRRFPSVQELLFKISV